MFPRNAEFLNKESWNEKLKREFQRRSSISLEKAAPMGNVTALGRVFFAHNLSRMLRL